ncbi:MAG: hypothetical protein IJ689_07615 [Alphaproteobacteria bacterium]|nr:hypothetical protein [Alphaproteobacteria bacterium]
MKNAGSQKGYTLIESIAFIAIISMVAISIIKVINSMMDRYKVSRVNSQVVELQRAISNRFSASANYSTLNNALLKRENLAPGDVHWVDDTMYNKFDGQITVNGTYSSTVQMIKSGEAFEIQFQNLPKNACVELVTQDWQNNQYAHLATMIVNGKWCYWRTYPNAAYKDCMMPLSYTLANSRCSSTQSNTIRWIFQ